MHKPLAGLLCTLLSLSSGQWSARAQTVTPATPVTPPEPGVLFCQPAPDQAAAVDQARAQVIAWLRSQPGGFRVNDLPQLLRSRQGAAQAYAEALARARDPLQQACLKRSPLQRRGLWLRAYACDGQSLALLAVLDRMALLGVTDVYLESFYAGRTLYASAAPFASHCRADQGNLLRVYTELAQARGLRLHAWIHATDFGPEYSQRYPERRLRNGFGQLANLRNSLGDGTPNFQASALHPDTRSTESFHWFVDPTHPAVQADLQQLVREVSAQGVDGVMLDYIRYPVVSCAQNAELRQGCLNRDPRLFWLFSEQAFARFLAYLRQARPSVTPAQIDAWLNPRLRAQTALDPALMPQLESLTVAYLRHSITALVRQSAQTIRATGRRSVQLSAAVWPDGNRNDPVDPRLQAYETFPLSPGGLSPMLYAYNLSCTAPPTPGSSGCVLAEFDRMISLRPQADFCVNLAPDPPYAAANGPRHAPLDQQVSTLLAYARSRNLNLRCVNYFAYGWLFPDDDQKRKAACEPGPRAIGPRPLLGSQPSDPFKASSSS